MATSPYKQLFQRLSHSRFRSQFKLNEHDNAYLHSKPLPLIEQEAYHFIAKRLAPATPLNDGKQTPWKGHPVFVAQHATATCCRNCLQQWHTIAKHQLLTNEQQTHIVNIIMYWLQHTQHTPTNAPIQQTLPL